MGRARGVTAVHPHHDHDSGEGLVPLEEARRSILDRIEPLPQEDRPLREAHGCVLTEEVRARAEMPPFASSAMDGYAVRASDIGAAGADRPVTLRIVGRVLMGRAPEVAVQPGQAAAIPTGGPIPAGADCVAPIETCEVAGEALRVFQPQPSGKHVRPAGEDARPGDVLLPAGRRLLAADLGLLAAAGLPSAPVRPAPRVAIVSTGDELVQPDEPAGFGQTYDANAFTLHGAVREAGAVPIPLGSVPDDPRRLLQVVAIHSGDADVMVSSGGISVGERDPIKLAFGEREGFQFLEVAIQPGKPQAFGLVDGRPFFGLPGNPVSVFVSFELFVRPALMKMMGRPLYRPEVSAVLQTDITGPEGKIQFARVLAHRTDEGWVATSTGGRQSNLIATVARANGLAIVPAGVETLHAGEECRVILFRDQDDR
jgi:molybdopterin molybdotransferase